MSEKPESMNQHQKQSTEVSAVTNGTSSPKSHTTSQKKTKHFTKSSSGRGKSFKKKKHVKKQPVAKPQAPPTFLYVSKCHNVQANKPKTGSQRGKSEDDKNGLGGWRCSECNKPTKVNRTKKEEPKSEAVATGVVEVV